MLTNSDEVYFFGNNEENFFYHLESSGKFIDLFLQNDIDRRNSTLILVNVARMLR